AARDRSCPCSSGGRIACRTPSPRRSHAAAGRRRANRARRSGTRAPDTGIAPAVTSEIWADVRHRCSTAFRWAGTGKPGGVRRLTTRERRSAPKNARHRPTNARLTWVPAHEAPDLLGEAPRLGKARRLRHHLAIEGIVETVERRPSGEPTRPIHV